ncbi:exodeoxyribonuclease VII small subunit [Candidatus Woesearchaeota archaeon]|nr:exodeoxyribonuclease VII small subunit [Candidatus Woesearchaeota archaeon]
MGEIPFESKIEKLKAIVEELESGKLTLKDSLQKFEESVDIVNKCNKEIEQAELKIEVIMKKDDKIKAK